jgi:glycosyltransferase involved in cell wall biosynthesis
VQKKPSGKQKILIFSTSYYPFVGGAEVAVKEITDRILETEFDLITAKRDKNLPFREKIGNVMVYRLGIGNSVIDKLILPFEGAFFARHLKKRNEYRAFWCVMATFASGAAYVANILSNKKVPIILNLQEGDSEEHLRGRRGGLVNLSTWLAVKRASIITVLSKYLADRARKLGFKGEIKIIPNGVDIERFGIELSKIERLKIREELGLKEEDVALVTSSRLNVKNGIGDVIKALTNLPENIKFVIFGVGELEDELKLATRNSKLESRVFFMGFVSHDDLPKYMKACDMFIRPSLSEGFGNSFIEAMAAGLPVIATPVGGIVDFLRDGETGYFCEPDDPESIAETVKRVIADPRKPEIINAASKMVQEKYTWSKIALQMKDIFKNHE